MAVSILTKNKTKSYLRHFLFYDFDNLMHLLFELFSYNELENKYIDNIIYDEIISLGYKHVRDIAPEVKKQLEKQYFQLLHQYDKDFDEEKYTYLLMAKIVSGDIIMTIDDKLIEDYKVPIHLNEDSVISFIDKDKLNNYNFSTL